MVARGERIMSYLCLFTESMYTDHSSLTIVSVVGASSFPVSVACRPWTETRCSIRQARL